MRNAFAQEIEELADRDERVIPLSGDIGNRLFNSFKKRFPDRFYNCEIAEHNLMSVAAGLEIESPVLIAPRHVYPTINLWDRFHLMDRSGHPRRESIEVTARNR